MSRESDPRIYPAPETESSDDFEVSVDGTPVFVHPARVSAVPFNQVWPGYQRPLDQTEVASFAHWDADGPVTVEVESATPVRDVRVRPASAGIDPTVEGDTVTFQMGSPEQVVVEVNDRHEALHLFANPPEGEAPDPTDPTVRFFGPGVHDAGVVDLDDGETVYVAGGAVVHGAVVARDSAGVTVAGRGVLDASTFERSDVPGAVSFTACEDVDLRGVVLRDSNAWTVTPAACEGVTISNVKLVGHWRYNADGIDVVNSRDVTIEDCFVRSFDDSIAIKGMASMHGRETGDRPVADVSVSGCVIWNDWGRAFEVGAETVAPEIRDLTFSDCDVVHATHVAMDIQHGDAARVHDVTFEDIRCDFAGDDYEPALQEDRDDTYEQGRTDYVPDLFVAEITETPYSHDEERGTVREVTVADVTASGGAREPASRLEGHDADHDIRTVEVVDLVIDGTVRTAPSDANLAVGDHVEDVTVTSS